MNFKLSLTATLLFLLATCFARSLSAQTLVDVIPAGMTNEEGQDAEPFITFNPSDPRVVVISASERANTGSTNGPLFVSFDGGTNWVRRDIIPTCSGCWNTGDITIAFTADGRLMAAILSNAGTGMPLLMTTDPMLTTPMTSVGGPTGRDQPYITGAQVFGWYDPGFDRAYVGNNAFTSPSPTARIDQTLDAAGGVITSVSIDTRTPIVFDNYQIRPVVHPSGTLYVAYIRRTSSTTNGYNADIVVLRDNAWAKTAPLYSALSGSNGVTVASVEITDNSGANTYGGERIGGDMAIAVDPFNAQTVYLSYAARTSATDPMTLHLRRSTNGGGAWEPDLRTISNAKNGSIAINSRGRIAYLYQQLTGTAGSRRWQTHLQRSNDGTTWEDVTMSNFPGEGAGAPPRTLSVYVADYERVISVGKNFYGVFTASNDPTTFPIPITYLRNRSGAGVLVRDDMMTPVAISLDPIFFRTTEAPADADVYVRDWTDSASVRDHGLEPSARADFFHTSDVWNRRSDDPQPFDALDRPQSEDPRPAAYGHNWAFTRVSREASATVQAVNVEFLFSDGGVGTNYVSAGTTTLNLAAGAADATIAAGSGLQWDLPSGASNHVCLATQISTAVDPYLGATLAGRSPGWPALDLEILNDNNKAQRNMQVYTGMSLGGGMSMFAAIHNAGTELRDMEVGLDYDADKVRKLLVPKVRFIGGADGDGRDRELREVKPHSSFKLLRMRPGETRWIEVTADGRGENGTAELRLYELLGSQPINGYLFQFRSADPRAAIRAALEQHAAVVARLVSLAPTGAGRKRAAAELDGMKKLLAEDSMDPKSYPARAKESVKRWSADLAELSKSAGGDPFELGKRAEELAGIEALDAFAAAHLSFLNRVDAQLSMIKHARGDVADVAQMVRWQRRLAERGPFEDAALVKLSELFLAGYGKPQKKAAADRDSTAALRKMLPALKAWAAKSGDAEARARFEALARAKDLEAMEGAHRELLWRLEEVAAKK